MSTADQKPPAWAIRFRDHMALHHISQEQLGEALGRSQGAIGHWLRGIRDINLREFFALCAAAGADPKVILFGAETADPLVKIRQILDAHPEQRAGYQAFEKTLRPVTKRHKKHALKPS